MHFISGNIHEHTHTHANTHMSAHTHTYTHTHTHTHTQKLLKHVHYMSGLKIPFVWDVANYPHLNNLLRKIRTVLLHLKFKIYKYTCAGSNCTKHSYVVMILSNLLKFASFFPVHKCSQTTCDKQLAYELHSLREKFKIC